MMEEASDQQKRQEQTLGSNPPDVKSYSYIRLWEHLHWSLHYVLSNQRGLKQIYHKYLNMRLKNI